MGSVCVHTVSRGQRSRGQTFNTGPRGPASAVSARLVPTACRPMARMATSLPPWPAAAWVLLHARRRLGQKLAPPGTRHKRVRSTNLRGQCNQYYTIPVQPIRVIRGRNGGPASPTILRCRDVEASVNRVPVRTVTHASVLWLDAVARASPLSWWAFTKQLASRAPQWLTHHMRGQVTPHATGASARARILSACLLGTCWVLPRTMACLASGT